MIKNNNIKNMLTIGTIYLFGLFPTAMARTNKTAEKPIFNIPYHCKFINNDSALVVNYTDTLSVHKVYKIIFYDDNGIKQQTCIVSKKNDDFVYELIFNPEYYKNIPWIPTTIQTEDTIAQNIIKQDKVLTREYYMYDNTKQYNARDSIEQKLLKNRQDLLLYTKNTLKKQKTL